MRRIATADTRAARPPADDTAAIREMTEDLARVRRNLNRTITGPMSCKQCGRRDLYVYKSATPQNGRRMYRLKCRSCGTTDKLIRPWPGKENG